MYNEEFEIKDNSLEASVIDELYCLSDVMPGCKLQLSETERTSTNWNVKYAPENPAGTFQELIQGKTYYCIVFENQDQYNKDMAELKKRLEAEAVDTGTKTREEEGCSCLYGNPCMDQYICKDWNNRFAVAKKNGWKGF